MGIVCEECKSFSWHILGHDRPVEGSASAGCTDIPICEVRVKTVKTVYRSKYAMIKQMQNVRLKEESG